MRREKFRTVPTGPVVTHTHVLRTDPGASWDKVAIGIAPNPRWTKTVIDGFGRTLEVTTSFQVGTTGCDGKDNRKHTVVLPGRPGSTIHGHHFVVP